MPRLAIALSALLVLAGCANTIRGAGQDAANTVDASRDAAGNVADAAN